MKEKLAFVIGTGFVSLSVGLIAYAVGQAQYGPSWELPARAARDLLVFSVASLVFDGIAVVIYLAAGRFRTQGRIRRICFWLAFGLGIIGSACVIVFEPGQWPNRNSSLSHAARTAAMPIVVACSVFWLVVSITGWTATTERTQ